MISQTVEYALRALVVLAKKPDLAMTTGQISDKTEIPLSYLRKIMQQLGKAGLVKSQRGKKGGFLLAVLPKKLTILQIVNAIDPIRPLTQCPLKKSHKNSTMCPLHKMLQKISFKVQQEFAAVVLYDLIKTKEEKK